MTLTDVRLRGGEFAFWRDAMSPGDVDVFIPAYPAALQSEPQPRDLRLLLQVQDADEWGRHDTMSQKVTDLCHGRLVKRAS